MFTYIDLFAGVGGFSLALNRLQGHCLGYSEINQDAITYYRQNHPHDKAYFLGDITQLTQLPPHDLLVAGVPCQSWSIGGFNLGFDDQRGLLWHDTIQLLKQSQPKAFIFENVKGLYDVRNQSQLKQILNNIKDAGYTATPYLLNLHDYGIPQQRVRLFIIGFRSTTYAEKFILPKSVQSHPTLNDFLRIEQKSQQYNNKPILTENTLNNPLTDPHTTRLSTGLPDYFIFNDVRNGDFTIHSWDIIDTTPDEKRLCLLLLNNRRKKRYGKRDGNPLSCNDLHQLRIETQPTSTQTDKPVCTSQETMTLIDSLCQKQILKAVPQQLVFCPEHLQQIETLTEKQCILIQYLQQHYTDPSSISVILLDDLRLANTLKKQKVNINKEVAFLIAHQVLSVTHFCFDFKNSKISTGLFGVYRIFTADSRAFSTLVASDSADHIATKTIPYKNKTQYKADFIRTIYHNKNFRRITKEEACQLQTFPADFILPEKRNRWMKLIGNSVPPLLIKQLAQSIIATGVFKIN